MILSAEQISKKPDKSVEDSDLFVMYLPDCNLVCRNQYTRGSPLLGRRIDLSVIDTSLPKRRYKCGPALYLQQQIQAVELLPMTKQHYVSQLMLGWESGGHWRSDDRSRNLAYEALARPQKYSRAALASSSCTLRTDVVVLPPEAS